MEKTKKILRVMLLFVMATTFFSFDLPAGWLVAGSAPKSYDMGIEKNAGYEGKNAATIRSIDKNIKGFGTLMQNCLPGKYAGNRVRMSGMVKTKDVSAWCGLWFRIDQRGSTRTLGFDNMHDGKKNRSIKGTTDWAKYEIVLDVPLNASNLAFGALLSGTGQIWFDNLKFEIVDNSIPTTGEGSESVLLNNEPVNLDFEK